MTFQDKLRQGIRGGLAALVMGASAFSSVDAQSQEIRRATLVEDSVVPRAVLVEEPVAKHVIPRAEVVEDGPVHTVRIHHFLDYHGIPSPTQDYAYLSKYQGEGYKFIRQKRAEGVVHFFREFEFGDDDSFMMPVHHEVTALYKQARDAMSRGDSVGAKKLEADWRQKIVDVENVYPYLRGGLELAFREGSLGYVSEQGNLRSLKILPTEKNMELYLRHDRLVSSGLPPSSWMKEFEEREDDILEMIARGVSASFDYSTRDKTDVVLVLGLAHVLGDAYGGNNQKYFSVGDKTYQRLSQKNNVQEWNRSHNNYGGKKIKFIVEEHKPFEK
jgi:hypothetical protein